MTTWNCSRTDTMPISYTIIISSAGGKFLPIYSDRNLIVKTQCVKQMSLSGNCRASPVVSVSSKTRLTQLIQSSLQHGTVVAVFLYVLSFIPVAVIFTDPYSTNVSLLSLISPWHLTVLKYLSWTAVMTVSLALSVLELSNFSAWNKH